MGLDDLTEDCVGRDVVYRHPNGELQYGILTEVIDENLVWVLFDGRLGSEQCTTTRLKWFVGQGPVTPAARVQDPDSEDPD